MENTFKIGETFFVKQATDFARNDVIVYNYYGEDYGAPPDENGQPSLHWEKRICRIIAFSGDSVQIKNTDVIVNGKFAMPPPASLLDYKILSTTSINDFPEREDYPAQIINTRADTLHYTARLTKEQAADYSRRKPAIISVEKSIAEYSQKDTFLATPCSNCEWTADNFGPLKIPKPGETVFVDAINFKLFKNIPGIKIGQNTITEKLYFILGDNRHAAADSRYIGFISHSNMYGIVK